MPFTVTFHEETAEKVAEGKWVYLAAFFYDADADKLRVCFPEGPSREECVAMLRKFHCFPQNNQGVTNG